HLDGADLRSVATALGRLPVEEAMSFALQTCDALGEAHSLGIVHGDLTPEQLFLSHGPDGSALIKVRGLGISRQLGRQRAAGAPAEFAGSVRFSHYMAPEQMVDPTAADARTDVWTLGVLLHELLAGELPFGGKSPTQVSGNAMTAHPRLLSDVDARIPESLA